MLYFCRKYYESMNLNRIISNKKKHKITIALDFDGTCVRHRYPSIGEDLPLCVKTLKKWIKKYNVGLILDTMRSDKELEDAIQWFKDKEAYENNEIPKIKAGVFSSYFVVIRMTPSAPREP